MASKYTVRDIDSQAEWEKFIATRTEANFLHSWQWGTYQEARGSVVVRRGVFKGSVLAGIYVGSVERARRATYMIVPGGPIMEYADRAAVDALFDDLKTQASANGCAFVRIRPQLEQSDTSMSLMKRLGFRKAPMHLSVEHAGVLDLTQSEEEILKGMRQRLRRALRKAEKNDIEVSASRNPADIETFYNIQLQTAGRHNFVPFGKKFLKLQFEAFADTDNALLYTATHKGEILAQNFMIFYGSEASYHYGVSTELGTRLSGAPLLHMEAMREARRRGCTRYNFWGIVDEHATKHRFHGVSTFKRGFGVQDLRYTPTHDFVLDPVRYAANWAIESLRRKKRSL